MENTMHIDDRSYRFRSRSTPRPFSTLAGRSSSHRWTLALLIAALGGCADAHDTDQVAARSERLSIQDVHGEVLPGEQGKAVSAVYESLQRFGYFPNSKLEKQYPSWLPMVPDAP